MQRKSRKRISDPSGPGCFLPKQLVYSPAWRTLSASEKDVLLFFLCRRQIGSIGKGKRNTKAILNNGDIVFSFAEAKDLGICKSTFAKALAQLEERRLVTANKAHLDGMIDGIPVPRHYYVNVLDGRGANETWTTWEPKAKKGQKKSGKHAQNLRQFAATKVLPLKKKPSRKFGTG